MNEDDEVFEEQFSLQEEEDKVLNDVLNEYWNTVDKDYDDELNKADFERLIYLELIMGGNRDY